MLWLTLTLMPPPSQRLQPLVSLDTSVRIPDTVLFQELGGEMVLLNLATGWYFGLDPIGARIWQLLREHGSLQQAVTRLVDEFDVEPAAAQADAVRLASELCRQGLLELKASPP